MDRERFMGWIYGIEYFKMALVETEWIWLFWGMIIGIAASLILPEVFPSIPGTEWHSLPSW